MDVILGLKCIIVTLSYKKGVTIMKKTAQLAHKVLTRNLEKEADSYCLFMFHQPKAPEKLKKFSKRK